jgi:hypothetical protein
MEKITPQQISIEVQQFLDHIKSIESLNLINFGFIHSALRDISKENIDLYELSKILGTVNNLELIIENYNKKINSETHPFDYDLVENCEAAILKLRLANQSSQSKNLNTEE